MDNKNIRALETELRRKIKGDVLFDDVSLYLYSTDASLYQIQPIGIVLPREKEDIIQSIRTAAKYGVSILPRGGGTSLAGQTVGHSLIIDCSKYMNAILELNADEKWVRVEPGIVRDELNDQIKQTGLHFTPDVATSNRATVGGMVANNSAGTHSIIFGKTVDQVIELHAVLGNGDEVVFTELSEDEYQKKIKQDDAEGKIYQVVRSVIQTNEEEIRTRYPKIMRRSGGYALDELLDQEKWNIGKLICGSEGTLAFVTEAKVSLAPLPEATGILIAHFDDLYDALRAVAPVVDDAPAAVELLDRAVVNLAAQNLETAELTTLVQGDPTALLLIEFFGNDENEVATKINQLSKKLKNELKVSACTHALSSADQAAIWKARKAGLGLLMGMKGDYKPLAFIEDAAVPVKVLPEYIRDVNEVLHEYKRDVIIYAHVSVGLIHVRPILNIKQDEDVEIMRKISEQVLDLVMRYGGMMSGEHGDGLVRSFHNKKFFGPKLYEAFHEIKNAFDPHRIFNPGKIIDAQSIEKNLRIGPRYNTRSIHSHFHYAEDQGFNRAVEMCTGVGACRKTLNGTMCPSYMVTKDEEHSTRGRANALRAALTGKISSEQFTTKRLYDVFDLCFACKGCKAECPSNVDVAKLKYEFLAHYYDEHGTPLSVMMFSRPDILGRLSVPFAGIVNRLLKSHTGRFAIEKLLGVDRRRTLPFFANSTFEHWFKHHHVNGQENKRPQVVLFDDCFLNYYETEIGIASVRVLEALGFEIILAKAGCCGRAQISNGLLRTARPAAESVVDKLSQYVDQGLTIIGCEPSCVSAVKEDYPDLVRDVPKAKKVAENFIFIEDFVMQELHQNSTKNAFQALNQEVLYHGHCHLKALYGTGTSKGVLSKAAGCSVTEVDSGCCGMAGAFGYEKKHYDISMKAGERRLFPAVKSLQEDNVVVANGFSCRHQIEHATGRNARHAIEVLADALVE